MRYELRVVFEEGEGEREVGAAIAALSSVKTLLGEGDATSAAATKAPAASGAAAKPKGSSGKKASAKKASSRRSEAATPATGGDDSPVPTKADVAMATRQLVAKEGQEACRALMRSFGITDVGKLPEDQRQRWIEACTADVG